MIRLGRSEGMETLTSMLLLMVSALLIFGVLFFLHSDKGQTNDVDLVRMRSFQVKSLGEVLVTSYTASLRNIENDSCGSDVVIIWDGGVQEAVDNDNSQLPLILKQALSTTPDGLTSVLIVGAEGPVGIEPSGEFVSWSHSMEDGTLFRVYLSLHAGSLSLGGMAE